MRNSRLSLILALMTVLLTRATGAEADGAFRRLALKDYRDKMKAGWLGQMAGVTWGAPTEFKFQDRIIPAEKVPEWKPATINDCFQQDDLYVEMTFLRTLEQYGLDVSIRQAGIDFANSRYPLWCANRAGRSNLRAGIAPPDSSHPKFNPRANDIDYQIEADYSGLIAPGLPQVAIEMGEKFGRLMNYGDGLYAGQFIGAMYAAAFFESDPVKIAETALAAIPAGCQYAEMVRDLIAWYRTEPDDWEKTWHRCQQKYRENPEYQKDSNGDIDCKINGAYVLMGLLHGRRDPDRTVVIAMRGGMDSDCNPSSAAGVLFATMGFSKVPERFTKALDQQAKFSHTAYSFPQLIEVSEKLARKVVVKSGGRIETQNGEEYFVLPVRAPRPRKLEPTWSPGPVANSRFTPQEMAQIRVFDVPPSVSADVEKFAPGWKIADCGDEMNPGLRAEWGGRKNVLVTHPLDPETACKLTRAFDVPSGGKTTLRVVVGHDPQGDFELIIRVNGKGVVQKPVSQATATGDPWLTEEVDLSSFAGKTVKLELIHQPTGWSYEAAYWAEIALASR
ncbi:MAG: ADP-ribosylglycohydrolase family protein [Verrucomicrobiota bacterium]